MRVSGTYLAGITPRSQDQWTKLEEAQNRPEQTGFGEALSEAIRRVNAIQHQADVEAERIATAQSRDIHAALVAMQEAELSVELTVQVIQRAIDVYREISRMQI